MPRPRLPAALLIVPAAVLALAAGPLRGAEPSPAPRPAAAAALPPEVDPARDFSLATGQPWARAEGYLARLDFSQGVSDRTRAPFCRGCAAADVSIAPERRSLHLRADAFPEGMRVVLRFVRHDRVAAPRLGFPEGAAGDTSYMLVTSPTSAVVMYRDVAGRIAFTEPWTLRPTVDEHRWSEPTARWRTDAATALDPAPTPWGWMACVNGCCRFYGSPPPVGY